MKKTVALMLAIVLCLSVFAGCGAQDQQNQTDLGDTQQEVKEKVVVGLDDSRRWDSGMKKPTSWSELTLT